MFQRHPLDQSDPLVQDHLLHHLYLMFQRHPLDQWHRSVLLVQDHLPHHLFQMFQ
jgi:hypothetical protein